MYYVYVNRLLQIFSRPILIVMKFGSLPGMPVSVCRDIIWRVPLLNPFHCTARTCTTRTTWRVNPHTTSSSFPSAYLLERERERRRESFLSSFCCPSNSSRDRENGVRARTDRTAGKRTGAIDSSIHIYYTRSPLIPPPDVQLIKCTVKERRVRTLRTA